MKASIDSLQDVRKYLDRALERGVVLTFDNKESLARLRHRCYQLRLALRGQSKQIAEDPSDPAWNTSAYDSLTFHAYREDIRGVRFYKLEIARSENLDPKGLISVEDL